VSKKLVVFVFIGGMIAAKLILIYQGYWDQTVNLIFFKVNPVDFRSNIQMIFGAQPILALFLSFVGVGVMEEYAKFWIMKFVGRNYFKSIDDVIELAIVSALGFAFFENIVYFSQHFGQLGVGQFFIFAVMRVTVVTMVHMLCSGILGYYYGMAFFASPMLKIQYMKMNRHPILEFLKKVLNLHKSQIYHDEMYTIGVLLAMVIHALYDFLLTLQIGIFAILIMFIYFLGGFWFLTRLLKKKEFNLKLGLVGTSIMPKDDFVKLLNEVHDIKEKMESENNI
jgi:RsiW-degrading membrane proteinase PrsW (M82 family)